MTELGFNKENKSAKIINRQYTYTTEETLYARHENFDSPYFLYYMHTSSFVNYGMSVHLDTS